jgi:cobalt-zinc-cadmium efflux system outer membrane protein
MFVSVDRITCVRRGAWAASVFSCLVAVSVPAGDAAAQASASTQITFDEAARRTLAARPEMRRLALAFEANDARGVRATLSAPLEIAADLEGALGTGELRGLDGAELGVSLTSLFERGGKRAARVALVERERDLLSADQRVLALDLLAETGRRYVDAAVANEQVRLAALAVEQAEQTVALVAPRVRAARSPRTELLGAESERHDAMLAQAAAQRSLLAAQAALGEQWNDVDSRVLPRLALFDLPERDGDAVSVQTLQALPDIERFATLASMREAEVRLARAQSTPDWRWSLGVKRYEAQGDQALMAGFSVPLNSAARNQSAVREAEIAGKAVEYERDAALLALRGLLFKQTQALDTARAEVAVISSELLPRAREAQELTDHGYRIGRFPYRELALAKHQILALERRRLEAAAQFHRIRIEIERLTGAQIALVKER